MSPAPDKVLVPLFEGFEEIEAVTLIDVLRRGEIEVVVAGLEAGPVRGAHGIEVTAEQRLDAVEAARLAMIALPGGARSAAALAGDARISELLGAVSTAGGYVAAMCAAPWALAAAGLHRGRSVTSHPGFADRVAGAASYRQERVVVDGPVVTSRAAGTALEFALTLVGLLRGADAERHLQESLLALRPEIAYRVEDSP